MTEIPLPQLHCPVLNLCTQIIWTGLLKCGLLNWWLIKMCTIRWWGLIPCILSTYCQGIDLGSFQSWLSEGVRTLVPCCICCEGFALIFKGRLIKKYYNFAIPDKIKLFGFVPVFQIIFRLDHSDSDTRSGLLNLDLQSFDVSLSVGQNNATLNFQQTMLENV